VKAIAICLSALVLVLPVHSAIIHVPGDYPTIQAGIDAAAAGDTVEVACGTYFETSITLKGGIVLLSTTGDPSCVTVRPDASGRVFLATNLAAPISIEGITVRSGRSSGPGGVGAGIYVSDSPLVRLTDCRVQYNDADATGGGIWAYNTPLTLQGCKFSWNFGRGGAVAIRNSEILAADCTFEFNRATTAYGFVGGGAVDLGSSAGTFESCVFYRNRGEGGAAFLSGSDATFDRCILQDNIGQGAAINSVNSTLALTRSTLEGNDAGESGALRFFNGTAEVIQSIVSFTAGAGLHCDSPASISVDCCDFFSNSQGDFASCTPSTTHVIFADPLFCDAAARDFTLDHSSPCLPGASPCLQLIGALGIGCVASSADADLESTSWGRIKALYRR
jgi:hypothetical protein